SKLTWWYFLNRMLLTIKSTNSLLRRFRIQRMGAIGRCPGYERRLASGLSMATKARRLRFSPKRPKLSEDTYAHESTLRQSCSRSWRMLCRHTSNVCNSFDDIQQTIVGREPSQRACHRQLASNVVAAAA